MAPGRVMEAGFTGTRAGTTEPQRAALFTTLSRLRAQGVEFLNHGAAPGSDDEAHEIWQGLFGTPSIWPCRGSGWQMRPSGIGPLRLMGQFDSPLDRNDLIVQASGVLVVAPGGLLEERRSGTWATYRRAVRRGLLRILVFPTGEVRREQAGTQALLWD